MRAKVKPSTGDNIVEVVNVTRFYPESFHPCGYKSDVNYWIDKSINVVFEEEDLEFDFDNVPIDWEQRRYEIASNYLASGRVDFYNRLVPASVNYAIEMADKLIAALKGEEYNE